MSKSINFEFRKSSNNSTLGTIHLRITKNRKNTYKSLKLPQIDIQYWDSNKQRVKKNKAIDYKRFNDKIVELSLLHNIEENPVEVKDLSFIKYCEGIILSDRFIHRHSTRNKYITIINKLKSFLQYNSIDDLTFKNLNLELVYEFEAFLRLKSLKTGYSMSQNTIGNYMKVLKAFVKIAKIEFKSKDIMDPFEFYKYPNKIRVYREFLTIEEIEIIRNENLNEKDAYVRNLFLFQIFANGMRISDLMSLRFNNIREDRIVYKMVKTGNEVSISFHRILYSLLYDLLKSTINIEIDFDIENTTISQNSNDFEKNKKEIINIYQKRSYYVNNSLTGIERKVNLNSEIPLVLHFFNQAILGGEMITKCSNFLKNLTFLELLKEKERIDNFIKNSGKVFFLNHFAESAANPPLDLTEEYANYSHNFQFFLNKIESHIQTLQERPFLLLKNKLHEFANSENSKNKFLFKILKDEDFESVGNDNDFRNISEIQHKIFHRSRILHNRNIKRVINQCGINKKINSHISRFTYANLMLGLDGVTGYDISNALGHSSLAITSMYLLSGENQIKGLEIQKKVEDLFQKSKEINQQSDIKKNIYRGSK